MFGSKFISWPVFFISFLLGLLFTYCLGANTKLVNIYPTPENVHKLLFQDNSNQCFTFHTIDTMCPMDLSKIKEIPIQI